MVGVPQETSHLRIMPEVLVNRFAAPGEGAREANLLAAETPFGVLENGARRAGQPRVVAYATNPGLST